MTYTIKRNGQDIELTADECRQIWLEQEKEYRLDDVAQEIDNYENDEDFTHEVAEYVRSRIGDAYESYVEYLEDCVDWSRGVRNAIEEIAEDYEEDA